MKTRRIAIFDSHIIDYNLLITQLQSDTEPILLDEKSDGIEQILTALQGKYNLQAIDIISHGKPGSITLGAGALNTNNLNNYAKQLFQIGQHLTEDGDIFLYGCEVAKGESGLAFIEQFSQLTGCDVAASTTLTGAIEKNGNWILDAHIGAIGAESIAFQYNGVFADDFPTTTATTGSITIGSSSSGLFEEPYDGDWFQVSLVAGQTYEFRSISGLISFNIYGADSSLLADDTFSNGERILIYTATNTGTHYLEAEGPGPRFFEPTSYTVSAQEVNGNENKPPVDDYPEGTAGLITVGGSANGNFETASDIDWFQISLRAGQNYEFQLISNSDIPSYLTVQNDIFSAVGNSFSDGGSGNVQFTFTPRTTEIYDIEARADGTGTYTISVKEILDDFSNTTATTGLLEIGGSVGGSIETTFDQDWFQLSLKAGHTYGFRLDSEEIVPFFVLHESDGSVLLDRDGFAISSRRGGGDLDYTALDTGTYFLGVSSSPGRRGNVISDGGDYTVSVSEDSSSLRPSADRIFNWAESLFPNLLSNDPESIEISGFYARIYNNGFAVGERDDNLYFYNGSSINLIGAVDDFLSDAILAGF